MSRDQNAGRSHNIKDWQQLLWEGGVKIHGNNLNKWKFHSGRIMSRLKSRGGGAHYHSVQILLSSRLLPKNTKIKIYRIIILSDVQNGCETWSITLGEEQRLRVFENRVLRRIFGTKRDEVKGKWRKVHNEELNDLYPSPNIVRGIKSRRMRWVRYAAHMWESRGVYKVLVRKPKGKRPLGRPRHRCENNIKINGQSPPRVVAPLEED